jgi:2-C-methyl-D-erythritol 4-phosphate cytidylyltransferase / 2-C-methyl-D-erythritol 2,4-cyclodiphosphate synthase
MQTAVIIVAAGRGSRMGGDVPKQWQMLAGKPVLEHTLAAFAGMRVVLVIHPDDRAQAEALRSAAVLVEGGATRDASVLAGLRAL